MATTLQRQRLDERFKKWDANHNGRIERSDYQQEARRILEAFGESETTPRGQAVMSSYLGMWEYLAKQANIDPDGSMTPDQFAEVSDRVIVQQGDAGFSKALRPTISAIVDLCDTDGDRQVNPKEFKLWLKAIGVDPSEADNVFRRVDTNNNGYLTVDELVNAVRDFHAGTLDAPLLGK